MPLDPSARLGPYEILEPLGAGGMGEVYKARDPRLNRIVAIKVSNDRFTERSQREARAIAAFNHPRICQIYDVGPNYMVMEYIQGRTLRGPLPLDQALQYAIQICEAMQAAHEKGIIHRDLKPANILVGDSGIKLLDFGLAKITGQRAIGQEDATASESVTHEGVILGSLPYMAPEQLDGKEADARSDIFAFGSVLYELLTGRRAFEGESRARVVAEILVHDPPLTADAIPAGVQHILARCLRKNPNDRWQSMLELKHELESIGGHEITAPGPIARGRVRRRLGWISVVGTALALAFAALWIGPGKNPKPAQNTASIAVLPFVNMSQEQNQEYFSDGLTEDLLNGLMKTPGLRVTGRTSSFQFKGKNEDFRVIGKKLNVTNILEGSVRKQGNRVRITVRLIQARDGFQLWSDTFDQQMDDIFRVQEEIARRVTDSLKVTLLGKKTPPAESTNAEAYQAYLQGRYFLSRGNEENLLKSVRYFEQATKLDSGYAPAWVGLSDAYTSQASWGYLSAEEGYRKAREAVQRALALDPDLGVAHASLARLQIFHDWDWAGADQSCRRALELEPGSADAIVGAGLMALTLGRPDEAFARYHQAMEIDPLAPIRHHEVGLALHYAGRQQEAEAALKKSLELAPDLENSHCLLSRVYLAQSRPADALAEAQKETHPIFRACGLSLAYYALGRKAESDANLAELLNKYQADALYQIADVYAFRGQKERALDLLERAYAARDSGLTEVKVDPLLQGLRGDSRYTALLVKMRLPK